MKFLKIYFYIFYTYLYIYIAYDACPGNKRFKIFREALRHDTQYSVELVLTW